MSGEPSKLEIDEKPPVVRSEIRKTLIEFVENVKEVIGLDNPKTDWEIDIINFFGVDQTKILSIETAFPLFQQFQACYAVNKFIEKYTKISKIIGYEGEIHSAPKYREIQVTRKETVPLLSRAWVFIEWNNMKLVINIMFNGNYSEFTVSGVKKDEKILHDFSTNVKKWMKKNDFFKGEKVEYLPHGNLGFLEYQNVDWNSVILTKELKDEIALNIIFPLNNEDLCKEYCIPWRRGVLLAGIAGTGKTQLARVLCNKLDKKVTVIWATPKGLHDVEKVKMLFDAARYFAPTLLIIEDIDFISRSRDYITDPIVGELLTQLDGNAGNHGIFTLATTNRPELMDKALIERPSRFDVKLVFEVPDTKQRIKMVRHFATGKNFSDVAYDKKIAELTFGLTGAYIKEVITYGTLLSLKEGKSSIEMAHIKRALRQVKEKLKPNRMVS